MQILSDTEADDFIKKSSSCNNSQKNSAESQNFQSLICKNQLSLFRYLRDFFS